MGHKDNESSNFGRFSAKHRDMRANPQCHCTGCFGCRNKTPGMRVMKDDSATIAKAFVNSNLLIFLTPLTFGGYFRAAGTVFMELSTHPYVFRHNAGEAPVLTHTHRGLLL